MKKKAALSSSTLQKIKRAISHKEDFFNLILDLEHRNKFSPVEMSQALELARKNYPGVNIKLVDMKEFEALSDLPQLSSADKLTRETVKKDLTSGYYPYHNTVVSRPHPAPLLHELAHSERRHQDYSIRSAAIRMLFNTKIKLTPEEETIVKEFIEHGYMRGPKESRKIGVMLQRVLEESKVKPARDTWLETSELLANSKAYKHMRELYQDKASRGLPSLTASQLWTSSDARPEEINRVFNLTAHEDRLHTMPSKKYGLITELQRRWHKSRHGFDHVPYN